MSRRSRAQAHAKHYDTCSCGKVVHGNGARYQHRQMHIRRGDGHHPVNEDLWREAMEKKARAALAAPMATECAMDKDGTCASEHVGLPRAPAVGEEGGREPYPDPRCTCHARHDGKHAQSCELWNTTGDL